MGEKTDTALLFIFIYFLAIGHSTNLIGRESNIIVIRGNNAHGRPVRAQLLRAMQEFFSDEAIPFLEQSASDPTKPPLPPLPATAGTTATTVNTGTPSSPAAKTFKKNPHAHSLLSATPETIVEGAGKKNEEAAAADVYPLQRIDTAFSNASIVGENNGYRNGGFVLVIDGTALEQVCWFYVLSKGEVGVMDKS